MTDPALSLIDTVLYEYRHECDTEEVIISAFGMWCQAYAKTHPISPEIPLHRVYPHIFHGVMIYENDLPNTLAVIANLVAKYHPLEMLDISALGRCDTFTFSKKAQAYAIPPTFIRWLEAYVFGLCWPERFDRLVSSCTIIEGEPADLSHVHTWLSEVSDHAPNPPSETAMLDLFCALHVTPVVSRRAFPETTMYQRFRDYVEDSRDERLRGIFDSDLEEVSQKWPRLLALNDGCDYSTTNRVLFSCACLSLLKSIMDYIVRATPEKIRLTSNGHAGADCLPLYGVFFYPPYCFIRIDETTLVRPYMRPVTEGPPCHHGFDIISAYFSHLSRIFSGHDELKTIVEHLRDGPPTESAEGCSSYID